MGSFVDAVRTSSETSTCLRSQKAEGHLIRPFRATFPSRGRLASMGRLAEHADRERLGQNLAPGGSLAMALLSSPKERQRAKALCLCGRRLCRVRKKKRGLRRQDSSEKRLTDRSRERPRCLRRGTVPGAKPFSRTRQPEDGAKGTKKRDDRNVGAEAGMWKDVGSVR